MVAQILSSYAPKLYLNRCQNRKHTHTHVCPLGLKFIYFHYNKVGWLLPKRQHIVFIQFIHSFRRCSTCHHVCCVLPHCWCSGAGACHCLCPYPVRASFDFSLVVTLFSSVSHRIFCAHRFCALFLLSPHIFLESVAYTVISCFDVISVHSAK